MTDGNGGIGYGIAEGLAAPDAAVMIARKDTKSSAAVTALRQAGWKGEQSLHLRLTRHEDFRQGNMAGRVT